MSHTSKITEYDFDLFNIHVFYCYSNFTLKYDKWLSPKNAD